MVEKAINKDIEDSIYKFIEEIKKRYNVTAIILFGSYAKKQATPASDIDLIIDTRSELKGFALLKLICQIQEELKKDIDGFEKYEIITNSPIDKEIKETGVVVYEK